MGGVPDNTTKLGINGCKFRAKIFGWHHRSKLVESLSVGGPYKKYDLSGKTLSNSVLTKDEDIVKFYYSEPRCTFKFTLNGYLGLMEAVLYDNQLENVKKVPNKLPIFIVSGQDDPVGDNGVGVKKVYDLFKDCLLYTSYADAGLIREFAVLEPFGKANIKPQFADKNLSITKAFVVGKNQNVLRLNLVTAAGEAVSAVYFGDIEAFKAYYAEKYGSCLLYTSRCV